jgi:FtsZ-binding cell division protein ZapB
MFENKHYVENVYNSEIVKFINDSENLKMHSIFLSQQSGIAGKSNYQIDYNHGCILVYVHNTDYCREKVQIAVDIIDNLSLKINELTEDDESNFISKELLEEINRDYQQFALKKDTLIGLTKEFSKKSLQNLEEMKLPSLDKYFLSRFASAEKPNRLKNQYVCEICNVYICSTLKAMSAHKRGCKNSFKNTLTVTEEK